MTTDGWYPPAIDNWAPSNAGDFLGPVEIGVLHSTESSRFVPQKDNYYGHQNYPHFTVANQDGVFKSWQHISIRKAARALANRSGGVQTNREGCIQIEVVGFAKSPFTQDQVIVAGLSRLMRWIESQTKVPRSCGVKFVSYPESYGLAASQRLSPSEWVNYKGWLGHQHVPENSHGDPGAINISKLLATDSVVTPNKPHDPVVEEKPVATGKLYIVVDPRELPDGRGKPQYLTDLIEKRWITNIEEYNDILGQASGDIRRITLNGSTLDSIPTVGPTP